MIRDMQLAGLVDGTRREYLKAVRQLAAYYMISPDQLSERNVEDYILYVRDELGVAKGTFAPIFFGLKFFYLNTLGYDWPLFTKKSPQAARERLPDVRSDEDCRRLIATLQKPLYRGCFTLIYAYGLRITEAVTLPISAVDSKQMVLRVVGKGNKERIFPADRIDPRDAPRGLENPPQPAVALSQPATTDPPARCDRTCRVHPGTQRLRF